jgi:signal transduction histidine kinase
VKPLGVRAKLVLLSLFIVIVVSFSFRLLHLHLSQRWVDEDLRERAITFAREIAVTIGDRRELESGRFLQAQIEGVVALRPNVLQLDILVFRPEGTAVVATSHPASRLPFKRLEAERVARGQTLSRLVHGHGERAWEVMTPIVFGEEVAGAVAALFSLQRADALAARSRAWALGLTAGAAVVMGLLMSLAVFMVVERPLSRLMEAIRAVRGGTSEATAAVVSRDELGHLAQHFNEMMARINRFSDELQARVDEATGELAGRYAELEQLNAQLFRMQRSLSHAERLAVAGRLLAEVAHEIGTPLHSVAGHLELLRQDLGGDEIEAGTGRRLAIIEGEVTRMTQIIAQLLDLARRPPADPSTVDLSRLVNDTVDLVRPGIQGGGIELTLALDAAPALIRGRAEQLQQVILNLLTNAFDATPAGGRVAVSTRVTAGSVSVVVSDTGHGIPVSQHKDIFEPFFSTKEPGRGTGLGLFIVSQIVREHHGRIEVESEEGRGSTLRVSLPREEPA